MSSIYTATPDPAADGSNQTDVSRALKQTSEALIVKVEELEAAVAELRAAINASPPEDAASIITGATSSVTSGNPNINLDDPALDAVFDRAVEQAQLYARQAQAEARSALSALQTALDNFKNGYEDTNAVVNANIYNLQSQVGDNTARISEEELTRATQSQALAGRVAKVTSVVNGNSAAITTESITRANADSALAAQITTVQSQTNSNTAAISNEIIARTNADSALGTQITTVQTQTNNNTTAINNEITARTTADSALSTQINAVSARTDAGTASGFYRLTALSSPTDGAAAEFEVQVQATSGGAYVKAGMNIQAFSNGTRRIKFTTDQFLITTGTGGYTPFAVTGGQLIANQLRVPNANVNGLGLMALIDQINNLNIATYIQAGVIGEAYIGTAAITSAKIGTAEVGTLKIAGNAVTIPTGYYNAATVAGAGMSTLITVADLYLTLTQAGKILLNFTASQGYGAGLKASDAFMYVDGVLVNQVPSGVAFTTNMSMSYQAALSAGTYYIEIKWRGEDNTMGIYYRSLAATGMMR